MKVNFNRIIIPSSKENILNLITKFIQCKICMNLLNDPYDCLCCNQTFCKSCIINYIKTNNKCPYSEFFDDNKEKINNNNIKELMNKIKPSSSNFNRVIQSLKFYCPNKEKGCDDELNIEEISEHEKLCKFSNKNINKNTIPKFYKKVNNENNINNKDKEKKNKKNKENNKLKNNPNTILKKSRNSVNSQKDIFIKRDNNFSEENRQLNKKINNTEIFKETINYRNKNQLKQQDSIISFCDLKNYLDDKNTNTIQSSNDQEKEKLDKNIELNNSKLEEFMEQINQKLSTINKFLTINFENKSKDDSYFRSNTNNFHKNSENDVSEFNLKLDSENDKAYKNNSMAITNNYYDGSYINTINNYTNNNLNKTDYLDLVKDNTKKIKKNKVLALNIKANKTLETPCKSKKYEKYLKYKKNTLPTNLSKNTNKMPIIKHMNILTEFNDKERKNSITDSKINKSSRRNSINYTPKLGSKSQKRVIDNKNLNINNELINNSIYTQSERHSPMEEILNSIKNLENKMNYIEKTIQSNNCIENQEYSIQNEEKNEKINIKNKNKEELNEEKIIKLINELMDKKEENYKNILNEKVESIKKYITEQCFDEMKKSVLETNIDIMGLYHDKLDEFEKIINKFYKPKDLTKQKTK
jgi:hypothetical protein